MHYLADLDKETVDFSPNYDETEFAPVVLPSRIPNLLVNGSSGIAVGMATNIPPHNLTEVINACIALIDDPEYISRLCTLFLALIFQQLPLLMAEQELFKAYRTGRGRVIIRARTEIETDEDSGRQAIIITRIALSSE